MSQLELVESLPHADLVVACHEIELVVTRDAALAALRQLAHEEASPSDIQAWASFVRRGYAASRKFWHTKNGRSWPIKKRMVGLVQNRQAGRRENRQAELVRTRHAGPISPLVIEYDPAWEKDVAAAIGRLDELGDLVDGTIERGEILELMQLLGVADPS